MTDFKPLEQLLKRFSAVMSDFRKHNIVTNKKDFTCQLGEWLVLVLYDGERAPNSIQKYWDIKKGKKRIQVKSHSKSGTTKARWSVIKFCELTDLDELITIVFTPDYKLKEFYRTAWQQIRPKVKVGEKRCTIAWKDQTRVDLKTLPKQDLIKLFTI